MYENPAHQKCLKMKKQKDKELGKRKEVKEVRKKVKGERIKE
jgi:hypothetical protein